MSFIPVAKFSEIPTGSGKLIEIGNLEIALFRLGETIYATSNVCPHQGGPLAEGVVRGEQIVCPWHQWQFNIKDGTSPLNPKLKIKTYPVKQEGDQILISLS
jgi:NAD(P)H-dependent nitrite reductase small subunit